MVSSVEERRGEICSHEDTIYFSRVVNMNNPAENKERIDVDILCNICFLVGKYRQNSLVRYWVYNDTIGITIYTP